MQVLLYHMLMREPIFHEGNRGAMPAVDDIAPDAMLRARDRALLHRTTNLAIESAFTYGIDLPVGAVAALRDEIVGRHFAGDRRLGYDQMHAEYMASMDTIVGMGSACMDTIVVNVEPCNNCQDYLATLPSLTRVGFGLSRQQVADLGLVRPHRETIFERAARKHLPFEVVHIDDPELQDTNKIILAHTKRDPATGFVRVDREGLHYALVALNAGA